MELFTHNDGRSHLLMDMMDHLNTLELETFQLSTQGAFCSEEINTPSCEACGTCFALYPCIQKMMSWTIQGQLAS